MARPNRFNQRNPVQELQRRQHQAGTGVFEQPRREVGLGHTEIRPITAAELNWVNWEEAIRGQRQNLGDFLNEYLMETTALNLNNVTAGTAFQNWNIPRDQTTTNRIVGNNVPQEGFNTAGTWTTRAGVTQGQIRATPDLAARLAAEPAPRRRSVRSALQQANFRIGVRSRQKSARIKPRYEAAMVLGSNYEGKVFSYKVFEKSGVGVWYVEGRPVAEVDLDQVRLTRIMMPNGSEIIQNKTRLLWRQLGLSAVRYKDSTKVCLGDQTFMLSPGERQVLQAHNFVTYVEERKPYKQLELFEENLNGTSTGVLGSLFHKSDTKPVVWENINGRLFGGGISYYHDGTGTRSLNLNNPVSTTAGNISGVLGGSIYAPGRS